MSKERMLVNSVDRIRAEAKGTKYAATYLPPAIEAELVNQARSRAFIHLYLKVSFGLIDFARREHLITDGAFDGGIDGYYINQEMKTIYLIQSKFRATERNFASKEATL